MSKINQFIIVLLLFFSAFVSHADTQCDNNQNPNVATTTDHLVDNMNGTVSDSKTALVWKKCSEGQSWNQAANSCVGAAARYTWNIALQRPGVINTGGTGENLGENDWRLPNINELLSIVELSCWFPAINVSVFPSTPSSLYWSSSPNADFRPNDSFSRSAWVVGFFYGKDSIFDFNSDNDYVRLVRSGQ